MKTREAETLLLKVFFEGSSLAPLREAGFSYAQISSLILNFQEKGLVEDKSGKLSLTEVGKLLFLRWQAKTTQVRKIHKSKNQYEDMKIPKIPFNMVYIPKK